MENSTNGQKLGSNATKCLDQILWELKFNINTTAYSEECSYIMELLSRKNISLWSTEANSDTFQRPFVPETWLQVLWIFLFAIMVIAAIIGNIIVIWIILAHKRMRTVTNYFLLNLTTADLLTVLFNVMFNFIFMLKSNWPFGKFYCIFNNFIANITVSSSVFTITATSIDR